MSNKSFEIIDYTEKSIAVFGDTKSIKDDLKALGGRFNSRLNYNGEKAAGWIFPIHLRCEVEELLEMSDESSDIELTNEIDKREKQHESDVNDLPKCVKCMSFQEAIISVINDYGKDILLKSTIINILNDYNAFQESKAFKVILKHIISEGYLDQIMYMKNWDGAHPQLINRFVENTGFQYDKSLYIVSSLAYALGVSQTLATYHISNPQQQLTSQSYGLTDSEITFESDQTTEITANTSPKKKKKKITHKSVEDMDDDEFEEYIWSKIEWDHNLEKKAGLTFSNYQITPFNWYTGFKILFEVKGKLKTDHLKLEYIAYDINGRLRANDSGLFVAKGSHVGKAKELNVFFNKHLDTLDKVIISATYSF